MKDVNEIWSHTLELIKPETSEVSFNTWILTIKPIRMDSKSKTLYLSVYSSFSKNILEKRYKQLIENALKKVTNQDFSANFIFNEDIEEETEDEIDESMIMDKDSDDLSLNKKYTFDTFIVGDNNKFAHAASLAVAKKPGKSYNPLFLYGDVGLGKTHLMQAIGHKVLEQNKKYKILYVSSEKFTNDLINALGDKKNKEFRNKFRNIDVLLIDDIQFISGKLGVQEEFFHTFNTLYEKNKQIIISSDKPPKEIAGLENRLVSRFEWGLIADIQSPNYETRLAILRKKVEEENLVMNKNVETVLDYIAEKIHSNIRELEGALTTIIAYSSLTNKEINLDLAKESLQDVFSSKNKNLTPKYIKEFVCKHFNVRVSEIDSNKRSKELVVPRQIAMYLTRELTDLSLPKIGEVFGNRNHTTVLHACSKVSLEIKTNKTFDELINKLLSDLKEN